MSRMITPLQADNLLLGALAGALVIIFAALYALFFAWAKTGQSFYWLVAAYLNYAALFASSALLSYSLNLQGLWHIIVLTMLIGYLLAPHGIWRLCVDIHEPKKHIKKP